ncbi:DUF7268 family protein [Halomarina oriensis]|uniref:Uncharacterized protein n=1 Tax=Halomarina oriensis TaxID=671145 RepID=A0A6B0GK32_9EURY|nr:hypothetical protein [Halomarina oriensis]
MSDPLGSTAALRRYLRDGLGLLARSALVGAALGAVLLLGLLATGESERAASTTAFALGALVFGFGTLSWSGSVLLGGSVESAQRFLDTNTDWTEADSRRAMARVAGAGLGAMLAVAVLGSVVAGL